MSDLVGTCPKDFWEEWIAEGDPAGCEWSGEEWGWYTNHSYRFRARQGDRFYVVCRGLLRGYAPIRRVEGGCIVRGGGAVAVTIDEEIKGFRGLRERWWPRQAERPFPDWKTAMPPLDTTAAGGCSPQHGVPVSDEAFPRSLRTGQI